MSPTPAVRTMRRIGYMLFFGGIGFLIVALVYWNLTSNALVQEIRHGQQDTQRTSDLILDCTRPKGQCFKDGQRRTGEAVRQIALAQVAAVACADRPGYQTVEEIKACVDRTMKTINRRGAK